MTAEQLREIIRTEVSQSVADRIEEAQRLAAEGKGGALFAQIEKAGSGPKLSEKDQRGVHVARILRSIAASKGNLPGAVDYARKTWKDDASVVKALEAQNSAAGGILIQPDQSEEIIELLRPMEIVRALGAQTAPMPNGTLSLPKQTGGATASYVGESQDLVASQQAFASVNLTAKKLAALVPVSNDWLRRVVPGADAFIRNDMIEALRLAEDAAFLRGSGTAFTPKGIRNWVPSGNVIPANATVNLANVTIDLGKLILALENANVAFARPGWMMSPRSKQYLMTVRDGNGNFAFRAEMLQGLLNGFPFKSTSQIPSNLGGGTNESEVYLCDFNDVVIGETMNMVIDASTEAAYIDPATGALKSAFSADQTVVRLIEEHDLGVRHDEALAVLSAVLWI